MKQSLIIKGTGQSTNDKYVNCPHCDSPNKVTWPGKYRCIKCLDSFVVKKITTNGKDTYLAEIISSDIVDTQYKKESSSMSSGLLAILGIIGVLWLCNMIFSSSNTTYYQPVIQNRNPKWTGIYYADGQKPGFYTITAQYNSEKECLQWGLNKIKYDGGIFDCGYNCTTDQYGFFLCEKTSLLEYNRKI